MLGCLVIPPPPMPPPHAAVELLCAEPLLLRFLQCASVIMVRPVRELLSSFALPMETSPCQVSKDEMVAMVAVAATVSSSKSQSRLESRAASV